MTPLGMVWTVVCLWTTVGKVDPSASCDLIVWAPLAAGCGFLFLLLIITVCHCNRIRTKRCPHHYKKTAENGSTRATTSYSQQQTFLTLNRH
ncbi:hypothetical protein J4Q44_G00079760 [Coregonus suidteri]|uniref:Uncharacterized protein n=1 Tax=Coregonus suidteri TaxID=861788 RepID=A0AAN8LY54_9TELE